MTLSSLEKTEEFAKLFTEVLQPGLLVCLYGDIGTGKTTFVQFAGKYSGIQEVITSPSFVIVNEYYSGRFPVYHFDLYRLEQEGVETILSELEEYSSENNSVTFVEWAEFSHGQLLEDRLEVKLFYDDDLSNSRKAELSATGSKAEGFLERLKEKIDSCWY